MTFGEYVETLYSTGLFGTNKIKAGKGIFNSSGPKYEVSEISDETIRSWMKKKNQFRTGGYFPEGQVDETGFITYFRQRAKDSTSWWKIQNAFREWRTKNLEDASFRVDTETDDRDEFFWSLLNQFQKIFGLPETERKIVSIPIDELSPQKIRKEFLDAVRRYNVMEIINREPAVLNRDDSAYLNLFLKQMGQMNLNFTPRNDALYASIRIFINSLCYEAMTLEATLNNRFSFKDKTASVNMEDDEESTADSEADLNPWKLPALTPDLIVGLLLEKLLPYFDDNNEDDNDNDVDNDAEADDDDDDDDGDDDDEGDDIISQFFFLLKRYNEKWASFRREMNILYDQILVWQNKT